MSCLHNCPSGSTHSVRTFPLRPLAAVIATILLGLLSACFTQRVQTVVPAFSQAVSTLASNTRAAFEVVQQKYEETQAFTLVVNYQPGQRFDPASVRVLLSEEDLDARMKLLDGLKEYGSQLEVLAGGADKLHDTDAQLGASIQALAGSAPVKSMAANAQAGAAANSSIAAVNALGDWLVEKKLSRNLPDLIARMQQPVAQIRDLFKADIGSMNANGEGRGLRFALWQTYTQLIQKHQEYLAANFKDLSAEQRTIEIEKLPALVKARRQGDQTLAQTETSLDQLVKANAELLDAVKTKRAMRTEIDSLYAESVRIAEYYQSLNATK